jgi:hypothetical protein
MSVRPVDLQAPLPQVDEVGRVQRAPQVASERPASTAVVQGEPEVRTRQHDVAGAPEVAAEQAESEGRRRKDDRPADARGARGAADGDPEAPEPEQGSGPAKGLRVDVRGL